MDVRYESIYLIIWRKRCISKADVFFLDINIKTLAVNWGWNVSRKESFYKQKNNPIKKEHESSILAIKEEEKGPPMWIKLATA